MESSVVLAVLFGALLHAGWNTLVKSSGDKELDIALVHFLGAMVCLPLLWAVGLPPREAPVRSSPCRSRASGSRNVRRFTIAHGRK